MLFTHDDGDHFSAERLPDLKGRSVIIIGPPTILKPILLQQRASIEQIYPMYTNRFDTQTSVSFQNVTISCYHTKHFNHWEPLHNSYLIEIEGKRLYITGDSIITEETATWLGKTDAIVCNLVDEGYLKGELDENAAVDNILSYLLRIRRLVHTKMIIVVHLFDCQWCVSGEKLLSSDIVGVKDIAIPLDSDQQIFIE